MRRVFMLSALWLGLLGVLQPVLACAINPALLNCCPSGMEMPCDPAPTPSGAAGEGKDCCAAAPSVMPTVMAVDTRDTHSALKAAASPHGDVIAVSVITLLRPSVSLRLPSRIPIAHALPAGADIYLRTGRLRL